MDPISQGVVGAIVAHAVLGRRLPRAAAVVGGLAAMSPDLDVLIPSFGDPTAGWVWHRGPTHSVVAVPVLGVLCGLIFLALPTLRQKSLDVVAAATVGVATHAPLDVLTSYGTQYLWPLSDARPALDWMPIIDPIFTLTLLTLVVVAALFKSRRTSVVAVALMASCVGFGAWQHNRAVAAVEAIAAARGHDASKVRAMPSPTALSLWRGVYVHDGQIYADGVFVPYVGSIRVRPGESRPLAEPFGQPGSEARRHFDVFAWFADGYVHPTDPSDPTRVGDGRYSGDAAGFAPLWGLSVDGAGTVTRTSGTRDLDPGDLVAQLLGRDDRYVPLADLTQKPTR